MTKYIELLRKHQGDKDGAQSNTANVIEVGIESDLINEPNSSFIEHSTHNPYSQPAAQQHREQSSMTPNSSDIEGVEGLLEEQASEQPAVETDELTCESELLLAEDEMDVEVIEDQAPLTAKAEENTNTAIPQPVDFSHASFQVSPWLQHMISDVLAVFQAAQQEVVADISPVSEQLRLLLNHIDATPGALDALELEINRTIKNVRDFDESVGDLVQKSIMMMLYAIKTGQQLKLQQQELLHHMIAAMLHHIGMAMVADDIRHKKARLTRDELSEIKKAPDHAYTYLQSCHVEDESILLAAAQAAERYDGSGGTGLKGHEIAWSARLVGLLSMFEALIHFRPYRQRLLPRDAIREIVNHHKKAFDPVMLKALIESISLYPVGTFVQINTGEIGQVITVHNKFPLRPVILISMDKHGIAINQREINLKTQPNLMIQKCMYEESLEEMRQESGHR
ncbi:MAG: hypothetical protein R8M45_07355 [Ghiorsea sp.]